MMEILIGFVIFCVFWGLFMHFVVKQYTDNDVPEPLGEEDPQSKDYWNYK